MKILYTGGAKGADLVFEAAALKAGYEVHAFSFSGHKSHSKCLLKLGDSELNLAIPFVTNAAKRLGKNIPAPGHIRNLLLRNYYQVKDTEAVFAVSTFNVATNTIAGGTGWAVEMAIELKKPVFVYDQLRKLWIQFIDHKWQRSLWVPSIQAYDKITGIGSREINEFGINAINELF